MKAARTTPMTLRRGPAPAFQTGKHSSVCPQTNDSKGGDCSAQDTCVCEHFDNTSRRVLILLMKGVIQTTTRMHAQAWLARHGAVTGA
jgi:hypothetical protein